MSSERVDDELDVDELLRRVRQEVERRRLDARMSDSSAPPFADEHLAASMQSMQDAIAAAVPSAAVGDRLPPMSQLRGWRRRLAIPVARLILRVAQLFTRDQAAFNALVLELLRVLTNTVHGRLTSAYGKIDTLTEGLAQAIAQTRAVPELIDAGARTAAEVRALRERITGLEDVATRLDAALTEAVRRADDLSQALAGVRADGAGLASTLEAERLRAQHVRTQLLLQERRIATLLGEARPSQSTPDTRAAEAGAHPSDAFYVAFEDHFRGAWQEVKQRQHVYLPIINDAGAGTAERPVLDVGCGRGEWLDLLRDNGLVGRGVDLNQAMALESRDRGLDVRDGDALAYLRSLPAASVGAVTGMHILEHLEFATVIAILDECTRVLHAGGVAIFETPNPKNLVVGACQFYVDPTHRKPLHPDTMAFIAEARGLTRVHILPLHPAENGRRLPEDDSPITRLLNEYLFGPQDFAVVGYRR